MLHNTLEASSQQFSFCEWNDKNEATKWMKLANSNRSSPDAVLQNTIHKITAFPVVNGFAVIKTRWMWMMEKVWQKSCLKRWRWATSHKTQAPNTVHNWCWLWNHSTAPVQCAASVNWGVGSATATRHSPAHIVQTGSLRHWVFWGRQGSFRPGLRCRQCCRPSSTHLEPCVLDGTDPARKEKNKHCNWSLIIFYHFITPLQDSLGEATAAVRLAPPSLPTVMEWGHKAAGKIHCSSLISNCLGIFSTCDKKCKGLTNLTHP